MSIIFAVRDGIKDARKDRSPYLWTVLSNPNERRARLREGAVATGKIILLGILIDGLYQAIEFNTFFRSKHSKSRSSWRSSHIC